MKLTLALDYALKPGEEVQFLDAEEQDAVHRATAAAFDALPARERTDVHMLLRAREVGEALLAPIRRACAPRVSLRLLTMAVLARYQRMPDAIGRRWARLCEQLDARAPVVDLSIEDALWLAETWTDPTVRDSFPPGFQRWRCVLDEELARVLAACRDPQAAVTRA